jgi:hypothetical protein
VVVDGESDAGIRHRRRLVDLSLLAAVPGEHVGSTIIHPYTDDGPSYEEFAKLDSAVKARMFACERRMDGDDAPWTFELNIAATALAGVAWLALVLGMRWQLRTKAVAALPGLATLAVAAALTIGGGDQDGSVPMLLLLSIELSAAVALVAISAWQRDVDGRRFCACWLCCGVRLRSVPYTRSLSMWS